ncbi:SIR2 family protein [Rhodopseudomonas sp. HC1]|uniref:SIR2 family NAD-dependent protein deacylase n=1 Tax=Rhodopseudomonas infernalis TaxID=2897386 RepID=UPI001EE8BBC7|nr:SIR2 family protein [Rhodopseudomonas infernalis]MCG6203377.1 SIR2 family protein [Rhodopseudomonas infernalis]
MPAEEVKDSPQHQAYVDKQDALIRNTLDEMQCQPVFFIGSGFSRRYFGAPGWIELLKLAAGRIGMDDDEFNYLLQKNGGEAIPLGQVLQERVFEWAWKKGKARFPKAYFEAGTPQSNYLKFLACDLISQVMPSKAKIAKLPRAEELLLLKTTNPHAIITTNYDNFLESLFDGYDPIVGEQVIRSNLNMVGEIFKIHGSTDDPSTIVLTEDDYRNYRHKKKYISAKLLTYLAEHPVFIFGYGFGDPNVTDIIEDVAEIIGGAERFIKNIFYVQWRDSPKLDELREEYVVGSGERQYRVRAIVAGDFGWIYKAIAQERELGAVNTRVLRAMASRMYRLIRTDIPRKKFEVDYDTLENVVGSDKELPRILGLVEANNANLTHPFVLTQVGQQLGYPLWHGAHRLIRKIAEDKGVNIMETDNCYHCAVKTGQKSVSHKYSKEAVSLLEKVRDGIDYTLRI